MAERFLSFEERKNLNKVVSGLYILTDGGARDRRIFLQESAGLGRFVKGMNLSGSVQTFVADLIGRLEQFGHLPERPAFHALGALLDAVLDQGDLPGADALFVAGLIVRYSLVADPVYVDRLRSRYQLDAPAVRPPEQPVSLPETGVEVAGPELKVAPADEAALEAIINSEDNFLDINFLYGAIYCSHAVCLIESPVGVPRGTAFLVNQDLLLTNQHVLRNVEYARDAVARFGYLFDYSGARANGRIFKLDPDFFHASPAEELDYALVRLLESPLTAMVASGDLVDQTVPQLVSAGRHRGYLTLVDSFIKKHDRVNIIQHPDGDPLKVVMTQNYVDDDMTPTRVHYVADTMGGSSGSPVLNHRWQVVALHHSGGPYPPDQTEIDSKKSWKGRYRINEGIPVRAILNDFRQKGLEKLLPSS
jgi:hypothetical protein